MKTLFTAMVLAMLVVCSTAAPARPASATGPYAPAAGNPGTTAIDMDDSRFVSWATGWVAPVEYGEDVSEGWRIPQNALGKAEGDIYTIVSLGRGGSIVLTFDPPIANGDGWDFAVFENGFSDLFLELAYVEVSSDGLVFIRFPNYSEIESPAEGYGGVDPTQIDGLASKYRKGYGTPFDLEALATDPLVVSGQVDLTRIGFVRLVDVVGDGSCLDSLGRPIYDPYPTSGSAGFDLDAVGVIHAGDGSAPLVDIKAHGQDGPIEAAAGEPVTLSLTLSPNDHAGKTGDWWLVHLNQGAWRSFVYPRGWKEGLEPALALPLVGLDCLEIASLPLWAGSHVFYFAVDANADGNPDALWLDSAAVSVP